MTRVTDCTCNNIVEHTFGRNDFSETRLMWGSTSETLLHYIMY